MNIPDKYFLTPQTKRLELKWLKKSIDAGSIDERMIPYLKRVNKIRGVVSDTCCSGHTKKERPGRADSKLGFIMVKISKKRYLEIFFNQWSPYLWTGNYYYGGVSQLFWGDSCVVHFWWHRKNLDKAMEFAIKLLSGKLFVD